MTKRNNSGHYLKLTNSEVISRLKKIFNKEDYSYQYVEYEGKRKDITIFCNKKNHGFFKRKPEILFKHRGCFSCLKELDKNKFIKKVKKIHKNKYNYSLANYINYHKKIIVICNIKGHANFNVTPDNHHYRKSGCPVCGRLNSSAKQRKTQKKFLAQFKMMHKKKFITNKIDYQGAKVPIIIECKKHGEKRITPDSLLRGSNPCFECGLIERGIKKRNSTEYFINKAKLIHGNKYDYSKSKYITAKTKIIIICKKHKVFKQLPDVHLSGAGCDKCGNEIIGNKRRNSIEKVIRIFEEKRGKGNFDYSSIGQTYKSNKSILLIKCNKHNKSFYQCASDHEISGGCDDCKYKSIGEELVMNILAQNNVEYIHNWADHDCYLNKGKAKFDFFLPYFDKIIEYDGEQHFRPVQYGNMSKEEAIKEFRLRKIFDRKKDNWAKKNKKKLLRIKFNENPKDKIFQFINGIND